MTFAKFLTACCLCLLFLNPVIEDAFGQVSKPIKVFSSPANGSACFRLDPANGLHETHLPDSISGDWWMQFINTSTTNSGIINSLTISGPDKARFGINSITLPYKLGVGFYAGSVDWFVHFQLPKYITQHVYSATLNIATTNDSCAPSSVPIEMTVNTQSDESVAYDLFHAPILYSEDKTPGVEHLWKFRNTSQNTIHPTEDIVISPGPTWYIRNDALKNTIAPGDTLVVDVINTADQKNLPYEVTVEIRLATNLPPYYDSVNVQIGNIWWPGLSQVSESAIPAWTLTANPNPARGPLHVAVDGASNPVFEVYDVLGNRLARSESQSAEWTWPGTDSAGEPVANGSYYLRAIAEVNGTESIRTVRIAMDR